jgi:thiol-disulfide isomerase/thioredoxin
VEPSGDALTLTRLPGRFEPRPSLAVGAKASSFSLDDLEGRRRSLDEFRGKVVLLDFWTLGCAPCIWEMPELAKLRDKHRERGFEIVGIHVGPAFPQVVATCVAKGADWPQLVDVRNAVASLYRVESYPTKFLLDRKGRILWQGVGGAELTAALAAALP